MSETSEHSPDDTDAETKTMQDLPNDSSKSEAKLMMNQTSTALLEDEEMPTYISVSSISKREDDSDVADAKQPENASMEEEHSPSPYPSDDQAASSVYILSSGEETDQLPYNDEDDEDEYGDSDVMENLELDNDIDAERANDMKHLMDEEEDDDDDDEEDEEDDGENPIRMHNHDDDIDECYDRASADFVLNKGLKRRDKEKSSSLQDLSLYKNSMYTEFNRRKHLNVARQNYLDIPQDTAMFPMEHKQQLIPGRYHHVQSKVKLYIKELREQNRRSTEKHTKNHEDTAHTGQNDVERKNDDTGETTSIVVNKVIKNYAEKTIKELEIAEACDEDRAHYNSSSLILNGQNSKNGLKSVREENTRMQTETQVKALFEPTRDKTSSVNFSDKMEQKQNGTLEATFPETRQLQDTITIQSSLIQNGHQEVPTALFNLRTLSYQEYMYGASESSQKTDLNQNAHATEQEHIRSEAYNNAKSMDVSGMGNDDTTYSQIRIKDIKSETIADEAKNDNERVTFDKANEEYSKTSDNSQVISLKDQLNQKIEQYNNLHDTYRKQLAENIKMKQELEKLRKSLSTYEKEGKPLEQKVASIQTDDPVADIAAKDIHNQTEATYIKQPKNKISCSSVGSTLSSIEQWTDSACNLSISMKPPELTKTLHSDDSVLLADGTPRKNARSLSRAFITSSRILQTLSDITRGKAKSDNPLVQNSKKRLNESAAIELQNDDDSYQSRPSSSKKRKIADILGPSNFLQPFKTPSAVESHLKLDETPNTELRFKCDSISERLESQNNSSNGNTSKLGDATSIENKAENPHDPEDDVKCFIYHENENSRNRSFLILAEEAAKDKAISEKSCIRECGPFLLGNVEVRMSEINGTINIWGKEVNDESTAENEKMETSTSIKNDKKCYCWHKTTPHTKFNGSNIVCSSSKKSKIPVKLELSSIASNTSCPHSTSFNTPKQSCSADKIHTDNLCSPNISSCENCDSSKIRKEWLRYKRVYPQEKLQSCCTRNVNILGQKCNGASHKDKQKDNYNCSKERCSAKEHRRNSPGSLESSNKHLNENVANPATEINEAACRCRTICHGSLYDSGENCSKNQKSCAVSKEASACEQLSLNVDRECNESCTHNSNIDEEEPLITTKQFSESPEMRRRRLSGKRVRGILMDLLRGCGDCYNPNVSNSNKDCSSKEVPRLTRCSPQIRISPCTSPEPPCSNPGQSDGRCCHVYAQRIESQLEEFRVEMEKMRSRSDAILDMLNMFHSMDAN